MELFNTDVNPNDFSYDIGKLKNIYTTTISFPAYKYLLFSIILSFVIGGFHFSPYLLIWLLPLYIFLNPRFCYVSIHENGILLKRRFSYKIIKIEELDKVELTNMSWVWNNLRSDKNKLYSFDFYLKNGQVFSYGERIRVFPQLTFPRIDSMTRVVDLQKAHSEISQMIQNNKQ